MPVSYTHLDVYKRQGTKIAITGRIQTGSYNDRDGRKVYTTEVVVEEAEFAESKNKNGNQQEPPTGPASGDGFMNIPEEMCIRDRLHSLGCDTPEEQDDTEAGDDEEVP